jgi:hypothetical protein
LGLSLGILQTNMEQSEKGIFLTLSQLICVLIMFI